MNKDDIIRMAEAAGIDGQPGWPDTLFLRRFAGLVIASERMEIRQLIESEMTENIDDEAYHLCQKLIVLVLKRGIHDSR